MNKVQLNNSSVAFATDLFDALKQKDIGLMQIVLTKAISCLSRESILKQYESICKKALPHSSKWPLYKTRSAVSFYTNEVITSVTENKMTIERLEMIFLELSIALRFNGFQVAIRASQYNLSDEQISKLLQVNHYE